VTGGFAQSSAPFAGRRAECRPRSLFEASEERLQPEVELLVEIGETDRARRW
jgi:hypothetical protein